MTSKNVALLMADLGVTKSLNSPYVSNDNPFSESHFKTLKYRPAFPAKYGCIEDARAFARYFFAWYNDEHRHSGIALMTPSLVHSGRAIEVNKRRQEVLSCSYPLHPERFVRGLPKVIPLPTEVWINESRS